MAQARGGNERSIKWIARRTRKPIIVKHGPPIAEIIVCRANIGISTTVIKAVRSNDPDGWTEVKWDHILSHSQVVRSKPQIPHFDVR